MKKSTQNITCLLNICVLLIMADFSLAQVTKDWYDVAYNMSTSSYYLYNKSENLAWGETYMQSAILDQFEASGDTTLLDEMVKRIDTMIGTMWDAPPEGVDCNRDVYEDGYLGWGSTYYDPNGYYQEYFVHDGMILVPITRFIRYVYCDSALYQKYGSKADTYLNTIEGNIIAKWYTNWEGTPGKSGLELENWGGWKPIPNNQYIILGAAMVILYDISSNKHYTPVNEDFPDFYLQESTDMANYFKGFMTHKQPEDAYLWGYWWTYPPAEYISYGYMELIFVLEAYHRGIVFDIADMNRYTNTFTELMWNGNFVNPVISGYIDGSGSNEGYFSWTWTSLCEFDFLVWKIVDSYHERYFSSRRKEGVANLALSTQLYDIYSPVAPTSVTFENDGEGNYIITWTSPEADVDGSRLTGLAGYNIYQFQSLEGPYTKINDTIIKSESYSISDMTNYYAVTALDYHRPPNESQYSDVATSVKITDNELLPENCILQNYPNPFNSNTVIHYSIAGGVGKQVTLRIFDINGKLVNTLVDENKSAGDYFIRWDGKNQYGEEVVTGIYFYRIEAGSFFSMKKMTFIK